MQLFRGCARLWLFDALAFSSSAINYFHHVLTPTPPTLLYNSTRGVALGARFPKIYFFAFLGAGRIFRVIFIGNRDSELLDTASFWLLALATAEHSYQPATQQTAGQPPSSAITDTKNLTT